MHIRRGYLNWGIFLIVLGAMPLAVRNEWLAPSAVSDAWRLWPLVLVGIGVGLVLRRTPLAPIGGLLAAATLGLLIGSAIATGPRIGVTCAGDGVVVSGAPPQTGVFSAPAATVDLHLTCGDLDVTATDADGWSVDPSGWPEGDVDVRSASTSLEVETGVRPGGVFAGDGPGGRLAVSLPNSTRMELALSIDAGRLRARLDGADISVLSVAANAADATIDLSGAQVDRFSLSANATDAELTLPRTATSGSVSVNAASLSVCVPLGVGLRVTAHEALASASFVGGFTRSGDTWESDDWATASERSELNLSVNVGAATVRRGGCG